MSISFNLDRPIRQLASRGFVFTWRSWARWSGANALYIKGRSMGAAQVDRVGKYVDLSIGPMAEFVASSGYESLPQWVEAAEMAHKRKITALGLFKVTVDEETRLKIMERIKPEKCRTCGSDHVLIKGDWVHKESLRGH